MLTLGQFGGLIPLADVSGLSEAGIDFGFPGVLPQQYKQDEPLIPQLQRVCRDCPPGSTAVCSPEADTPIQPPEGNIRPTVPARVPIPRVPPAMPTKLPQPTPVVGKAADTISLPGRKILWKRRVHRSHGQWGAKLLTRVIGRLRAKCRAQGGELVTQEGPGRWTQCTCTLKTYQKVQAVQKPAPPPVVSGRPAAPSVPPTVVREAPEVPGVPGVAVAVPGRARPGVAAGAMPGTPVVTVAAAAGAAAGGTSEEVAATITREHPEVAAKVIERAHPEVAAKAVERVHPEVAARAIERTHPTVAAKVLGRTHPTVAAQVRARTHPTVAGRVISPRAKVARAGKVSYSCPAGYRKVRVGKATKCVRTGGVAHAVARGGARAV